jgi:hypothetical protein
MLTHISVRVILPISMIATLPHRRVAASPLTSILRAGDDDARSCAGGEQEAGLEDREDGEAVGTFEDGAGDDLDAGGNCISTAIPRKAKGMRSPCQARCSSSRRSSALSVISGERTLALALADGERREARGGEAGHDTTPLTDLGRFAGFILQANWMDVRSGQVVATANAHLVEDCSAP